MRTLSHRDADALLSSASGHEFVNLDAMERDEPKLIVPPMQIHLVRSEAMDAYGALRRSA